MPREMRRDEKLLSEAETLEILATAPEGVLATVGRDNAPYAVPLNYAYHQGAIYFHCAPTGHKLDNIRHNSKVSFCVIKESAIIPAKFSTHFKSVVVFGTAQEVTAEEKEAGLFALVHKYAEDHLAAGEKYIQAAAHKTAVVRIDIDHVTGKGT
ncbi:MAG: pyridoxamine 5'-phosphate oxidase family protein [Desulfosarcinaceae bacterium]|nr:pyridoxamine 5'-phosphate oxidase family protein [Desulfosarcinaceae bacterium]